MVPYIVISPFSFQRDSHFCTLLYLAVGYVGLLFLSSIKNNPRKYRIL